MNKFKILISILFSIATICGVVSAELPQREDEPPLNFSLLLIEESSNILGIYDPNTQKELGRVALTRWPHEITVSKDGKRAYISNFGIRDHDLTIGDAGNSVSVIDLENCCEVDRLFTTFEGERFWAPHAVKLSPDNKLLFVNAERVGSRYSDSNEQPQARILVFDLSKKKLKETIKIPEFAPEAQPPSFGVPAQIYKALGGMHNFVFSPDGDSLWYFAGQRDVVKIKLDGTLLDHLDDFNGVVRALSFNEDGTLLVSATNEVCIVDPRIIDPNTKHSKIVNRFGSFGVTQLLYSEMTKDMNFILAPAVWEGQVVIIDAHRKMPTRLISTGVDPVHVVVEPKNRFAYVTHGRSNWVTEVDLSSIRDAKIRTRNILTTGGPNGMGLGSLIVKPKPQKIKLGACLPFTGEFAAEGRECRLGLQFWQDVVNGSGGVVVDGKKHLIDVVYIDTTSKTDKGSLVNYVEELLATNDTISVMLGTYPSAANIHVAEALDSKQIPFLTSTGRDPALFEKNFEHVFGISPLRQGDLTGAISSIFKNFSPKPRTAIILACDDGESLDEARATARFASQLGIEILKTPPDLFKIDAKSGAIIFSHNILLENVLMEKLISEIMVHYPDLLLVAGHRQESVSVVRACAKLDFTPGALVFNRNIIVPYFQDQLGPLAQNLFASVCWTSSCFDFALDQFVTSGDFGVRFSELHSVNPSEFVAGFAACGVVLEEAFKKAKSSDRLKLTQALGEVDIETFYGPISLQSKVNSKKQVITIQFKSDVRKMKENIVWPPALSGKEKPVWPFTGWSKL